MNTFQKAILVALVAALLGIAWMARYSLQPAATSSLAATYMLDRWTGTVHLFIGVRKHETAEQAQ